MKRICVTIILVLGILINFPTTDVFSLRVPLLLNEKQLSVKNDLRLEYKDEDQLRKIIASCVFTELKNPDGSVIGAQNRVLISEDEKVNIVLKIERTREETAKILDGWKWDGITESQFEDWVNNVHNGKARGIWIARTKLSYSNGIYPEIILKNLEVRERINNEIQTKVISEVHIQRKGKVLWEVIKELYAQRNINQIKDILDMVIEVSKKELWSFGVFDKAPSFTVNWAIEYDSEGNPAAIGLFDFGELVEDISLVGNRLKPEFWQNDWIIFAEWHPQSIISLTDKELANWFFGRVSDEFTAEELNSLWGLKFKPFLVQEFDLKPVLSSL